MKHVHTFEAVTHHGITSEIMSLGIEYAETRKCSSCKKEMIFVKTKKGKWYPLFDDGDAYEQDILLA